MTAYISHWIEKLGWSLAILLLTFNSNAQPLNLQPEMEMNYGLRHNSVRSIIQDSTGRTWLGTEAGIHALESNNSYVEKLVKELEKEVIISLCNTNNFLLVGTVANGLKIYDLKKHKQIQHPVLRSIRYARRIRLLRGDIFIAANSDS
jgi:ligand-binding sensor domain-containing protein